MNFHQPQSNILINSQVCYYVELNQQGEIIFANDYYLQQFIKENEQSMSFAEAVKGQNVLFDLYFVSGNKSLLQNLQLGLINKKGQSVFTRWDFAEFSTTETTILQGIGVASPQDQYVENLLSLHLQNNPSGLHEVVQAHNLLEEEKYKFLFYDNPLPMWIYEVGSLRFLEVNDAAVLHYGYSRQEFLQMKLTDIRPVEEIEKLNLLQRSSNTQNTIYKGTWKHKKKNGEIIDVFISAHKLNYHGTTAKMVLVEDRTDQSRAERKLIESNERYTYASKATFDAIWDWDIVTNNLYWSDGFTLLFGYKINDNRDDIFTWYNHIHPDEKERVIASVNRALKSGSVNWIEEYKFIKSDGTFAYVIDRGIIIRNEVGEPVRMIGAKQDITIRKVNEQQLQKINLQLLRQQKERELTSSILRSLTEKELLNDALEDILRKLTIFFNFEIGEAWFINMDKVRLELRQKWYGSKAMDEFYNLHPDVTYKLKEKGLLGSAWNETDIIFVDDLANYQSFVRKEGAVKAGLSKSLGVPILFKGEPIAVFSFFGKKEIADKEKVRNYFEGLSLQLGLDIQRKKTEEELNKFFALSPDILSILGFDGYFKKINPAFCNILDCNASDILQSHYEKLIHHDDLEITNRHFNELKDGKTIQFENRFLTKDGGFKWLSWAAAPLPEEGLIYATAKDITEKKELDSRLNRILESISDGFLTVDKESNILYLNRQAELLLNLRRNKVQGKKLFDIFRNNVPPTFFNAYISAFNENKPIHVEEYIPNNKKWFEVSAYPYQGILSVFFKEITERKKTEEIVRISSERYEVLAKATKDVIWDWNLITNSVTWNESLRTSLFYDQAEVGNNPNWWYDRLHPEDRERITLNIKNHIAQGKTNWEGEYRFCCGNGTYKYIYDRGFTIYDNNRQPIRMIGAMQDLTETKANEIVLKELNDSLEKRAVQLATSNAELESFAYVASHDLQEPLRMVSSFLQLIEKKYKDKLDEKAHEYIRFAVDGSERMKGLILDLLEYSRVNSRKAEKEMVDLNKIAEELMIVYKKAIKEANGKLVIDNLPVVIGNKVQLMQLFQNLTGNALKYKSDQAPVIKIQVEETDSLYKFSVSDNGIGIESRFFKKIFIIFQRLHNKNQYSGTGIGLAICKKIVDLHSGDIWVKSQPGVGSVFYFTIPKKQSDIIGIPE